MYKLIFSLLSISLLLWAGCKTEAPVEPTEGVVVGEATFSDLGLSMELIASDSLFSGYQTIKAALKDLDTDEMRTDLELTVVPMMTMTTMTHSAPFEPNTGTDADGYYPFQVVFIMPTSEMGYWELKVTVRDPLADMEQTIMVPIEVTTPEETRVRNMVATDDSSFLFVSLVEPFSPEVGMNEFTLAVHQRNTMMDFPAVEDLTLEIEPTMPSMNHGSPNNVHPVHVVNGHYKGQVNFTMDGWWQVHVWIKRGETVIGEMDFNITFSAL